MSDESIFQLINDLCTYHLKDVKLISNKLKFRKKLKSLSYETLFLFQNAKKISNTTLTSHEKLLSHISDLKMKGFLDQAEKLNFLIEKINISHVDTSEVGILFTFLINMFNSGQQSQHIISQAIPKSSRFWTSSSASSSSLFLSSQSSSLPASSDFTYPEFNDDDFIMADNLQSPELLSVKEFEKAAFGSYKNFKEFAAFNLQWTDDFDLDCDSSADFQKELSPTPDDVDPWVEASKMKMSKRMVWEDVGRKNPLKELPYLTESPMAIQQLLSSTFSNSSEIPRFEDLAGGLTNLLLGIPSSLFSFNEDSVDKIEHKALKHSCLEFIEMAESCRQLLQFCDKYSKDHGPLCTSFCEAIQSYLERYCSTVLSIKDNCSSVGDVHFKYKKFFKQLRYLARLCRFENADISSSSSPPKDASLLSHLYVRCMEVEEDPELRPLLLFIFKWTCVPYFRILEEWIFSGRSNANERHMIVKLNPDVFVSRDETFWDKYVSSADSIPCFLKEAYRTAIDCGKSICLLRMCSGETKIPSSFSNHPPMDLMLTTRSLKNYQDMYKDYKENVLRDIDGDGEVKMSEDSIISTPKKDVQTNFQNNDFGEEIFKMGDFHSSDDINEDTLTNFDEETETNVYIFGGETLVDQTSQPDISEVDQFSDVLASHQDNTNEFVEHEQLVTEIINKVNNNVDGPPDGYLTPSQIRSTPGYIPHRKQIKGTNITKESSGEDIAYRPHIRVDKPFVATITPVRPHIKSVQGSHPSKMSKDFPWINKNKYESSSDESKDVVLGVEDCELDEEIKDSNDDHDNKPLSKSCSTETLVSSGYSSINSDIFTYLETDILKFDVDDKKYDKNDVERFLDYHNDTQNVPLNIWIRDSLLYSIEIQSSITNKALMDYFLNDLRIYEYFDVFQRFVMLQDAQFATALVERLGENMHEVNRFGIFNPSVMNSTLKYALSTTPNDSSNLSSKLSFTVDDHPHKSAPTDILGLLKLTLTVDWPACIVIQKRHLNTYGVLFAFIFKLKRILWCVNDIFSRLKRDATIFMGGRHQNPQFRCLHLFRHHMQHFVRALHDYISDQVLTVSWLKFHERVNLSTKESTTRSLDQLIDLHTKFVNECMSICLLEEKTSSIMNVMDLLFDHVLLFHSLLKSESWIAMADSGPDGVFHPKFKLLFETYRKFEEASTFLEKMLVKLEKKTHITHVSDLLVRLKFN